MDCWFEFVLPEPFCVEFVEVFALVPELLPLAEAGLLTANPTATATAPAPAAARIPVVSDPLRSMPLRRRSRAYLLGLFTIPICPAPLRSLTGTALHPL